MADIGRSAIQDIPSIRLPGRRGITPEFVMDLASLCQQKRALPKWACVYFMRQTGFCKIGYSTEVKKRQSSLQVATPNKIDVVMVVLCLDSREASSKEKNLHSRFRHKHVSGEWYSLDDQDLNNIAQSNSEFTVDYRSILDEKS